jgi:hypothetical protein
MSLKTEGQILDMINERKEARGKKELRKNGKVGNGNWTPGCPSPNPNGRPKGTRNKWTKRMKEEIQRGFQFNLEQALAKDSKIYSPAERLKFLEFAARILFAEKKILKGQIKQIKAIEVSFKKELGDATPIPLENTEEKYLDYVDED